jgi:S-formylglutathione hydrolase FrmB
VKGAMLSLVGWPFLVAVIAVSAAVAGGTIWCWNRIGQRWLAWPFRVCALLLVMVCGGALTAVVANRRYTFYATFGELFGHLPPPVAAVTVADRMLPAGVADAGRRAALHGRGSVLTIRLPGATSGVNRYGYIYLPAAYFDPAYRTLSFAVVELFHGYPGGPGNWMRTLHIATVLDSEIQAHRMPPVIAVAPTSSSGSTDTECVNAVGGQQDETYLATDVPDDVVRSFRALSGSGTWAAAGLSTGGYCALNIALHHPRQYRAAVSLSGYATATGDASGRLFKHSLIARELNSPAWWVVHRPAAQTPALYVVAGTADRDAVQQSEVLGDAVSGRSELTEVYLPGGHNFQVWGAAAPPALDWLGTYLPGPLAPPLHTPAAPGRGYLADPPPARTGHT